jgi:DNA-binding response OmpR family regulator
MNAASASSKGTILVVDDNRLVLATLSDGLTRAGYHVYDADNGDDAILIARAQRPQLALLDIRMEGKSGFDVAHYLRHQCGMPFMFLSAFSDEQTVAQVKALGAVAYLVKPLDIKQIVPAVEAAFAHIGTQATAPAVEAHAAPPTAPVGASAHDTSAAMAVGVLMHRYSLGRDEAAARLLRLAREAGITMHAQAELLLAAVEQLAGPARH